MKNRILWTSALVVSSLGTLLTGCKNNQDSVVAPIVDGNAAATDPAMANLAPGTQVAGSSYQAAPQASTQAYPQQTGTSAQNEAYNYNTQPPQYAGQSGDNGQYGTAAAAAEYDEYSAMLDPNTPAAEQAPPPLPGDYEQPEAPGPNYLWTPGYWDYANTGYYYVPGTWVAAPYQGALWTPGFWGYLGNRYRWHHGYWGRHIGYYGGINYGFGYIGFGYQGGYWNGNNFYYNTAVNRVDRGRVNGYVYDRRPMVQNASFVNNTRVAYVGGPGGLNRRPQPQEVAAIREQHTPPMQAQILNRREAEQNRQQFFTANHGHPAIVAANRPLAADHVAPPPQNFNNNRPGQPVQQLPPNASPQQREQFANQQRGQQVNQQRQVQQANVQNGQREQQNQQRQAEAQRQQQAAQQQNLQRQQQQAAQQQRQPEAQRQQQVQQQANVQREQQMNQQQRQAEAQRQQQAAQQQQNVQRQQQATAQQAQQRQAGVQRQQQVPQQANVQREQQMNQQRQAEAQHQQQATQQQQAQQHQADAQRAQQMHPQAPAPRPTPPPAAAHPAPAPPPAARRF